MTSTLKIIRVRDFIRVTPQGTLDFSMAKELIQEVGNVSDAFVRYNLLIDTRGTEDDLTVVDSWEIASHLATAVHRNAKGFGAKIAVLCPVQRFDHAKFFELCSLNRGLNVRAFTSFEELFEWLSQPSDFEDSAITNS
jgi:hypothetical protein